MTKSNVFQFLYTPVRTLSVVQCNDVLNGSEKDRQRLLVIQDQNPTGKHVEFTDQADRYTAKQCNLLLFRICQRRLNRDAGVPIERKVVTGRMKCPCSFCALCWINEGVLPILLFVFLRISQHDIVVSCCYIHKCVVNNETSEREYCIEYDDQLLGVSIVCIRGDAGNYAMWLFELLSVTTYSVFCHRVFNVLSHFLIAFLNTTLCKREMSIISFTDKDTDGAAASQRRVSRVKHVVDNEESFMHTAQWMDGYGNKLQCLNMNTVREYERTRKPG